MRSEPLAIELGTDDTGVTGLLGRRFRFDRPGPRVLVTGAVHGDEVTATGAIWRVGEALGEAGVGGAVTLVPCVNQLAARQSQRQIPLEGSDLNRQFPGRPDGTLGERLAAALVALLGEHDALIDVHTAGWSTCFVLLDHIEEASLNRRVLRWAEASGLPVVGEMPAELSNLQGLDRSWSAWAVRLGKPAVTIELTGFHAIDREAAERGAKAVLEMLRAAPRAVDGSDDGGPLLAPAMCRHEIYAAGGGLFEAERRPGDRVGAGDRLGVVRSLLGERRETVAASDDGLVLALQPVSAVHVGSWLATLAVNR